MGDKINVTFETLFEILRKEKNTEEIQKLEPDFLDEVVDYLRNKSEILNKDEFSEAEKSRTRQQIDSIKKMIKDLYERREKKIILMVINKSRTGIDGTDNLLDKEKDFFSETLIILNKYRKDILFNTLDAKYSEKAEAKKNELTQRQEAEKAENKEIDEDKEKTTSEAREKEIKKEIKMVRFLQPIQKFLGKEMEIYGPFEAENVASLPSVIVDILIKKGIAEEIIEDSPNGTQQ